MKNISSIALILGLVGISFTRSKKGSQKHSKGFNKFLKQIKKSKKAQEAELVLVSEKGKGKHYKFTCKSLHDGQQKTWISSKTASDIRAAKNRRSSLRKVCGVDDIDEKFFRY